MILIIFLHYFNDTYPFFFLLWPGRQTDRYRYEVNAYTWIDFSSYGVSLPTIWIVRTGQCALCTAMFPFVSPDQVQQSIQWFGVLGGATPWNGAKVTWVSRMDGQDKDDAKNNG